MNFNIQTIIYFLENINRRSTNKLQYLKTNFQNTKALIGVTIKLKYVIYYRDIDKYVLTEKGSELVNTLKEFSEAI